MNTPFPIVEVVSSPSKTAILRMMTSRQGFRATGRQIASLVGFSVPSTHEALKSLHDRGILLLEVMGKQHIYSLNVDNRIVQKVVMPIFETENDLKKDIGQFLLKELDKQGMKQNIAAIFLYGSLQKSKAVLGSDVDIAVVVAKSSNVERIVEAFASIGPKFKSYFGAQLDAYIKSKEEFKERIKKNQPPVSDLMKSYSVLFGKEPLEV